MDIFLTNNLTNKKEQFVPKDKKHIGMYVCGPTVYDDPHIGNARPLVIFDILFKLLKNSFSKVTYVSIFTEVLSYMQSHPNVGKMKEKQTRNGLRLLINFKSIKTVSDATQVLKSIIDNLD